MSPVVGRSAAPAHDAERTNHRLASGHTWRQESNVSHRQVDLERTPQEGATHLGASW